MSLSTVLFLFLAHLGVGIAFTLVFVSRDAGVKFFRFNAGLAAILIAIALAFRWEALAGSIEHEPSRRSQIADLAVVCGEAALKLYWATVGRALLKIRSAIVAVTVAGCLVGVILQALGVSADRTPAETALAGT